MNMFEPRGRGSTFQLRKLSSVDHFCSFRCPIHTFRYSLGILKSLIIKNSFMDTRFRKGTNKRWMLPSCGWRFSNECGQKHAACGMRHVVKPIRVTSYWLHFRISNRIHLLEESRKLPSSTRGGKTRQQAHDKPE